MAALTTGQLTQLRQHAAKLADKSATPISFTKAQANSAFQGIEDRFEGPVPSTTAKIRSQIGTAIEDAVPAVFSGAQKVVIAAAYLTLKAQLEVEAL